MSASFGQSNFHAASAAWGQLAAALGQVADADGQRQLVDSSEALLVLIDRPTADDVRSMKVQMA